MTGNAMPRATASIALPITTFGWRRHSRAMPRERAAGTVVTAAFSPNHRYEARIEFGDRNLGTVTLITDLGTVTLITRAGARVGTFTESRLELHRAERGAHTDYRTVVAPGICPAGGPMPQRQILAVISRICTDGVRNANQRW